MPRQRTLLDGDTGAKFDSLELKVGEAESAPATAPLALTIRFTVTENTSGSVRFDTYTSTGGWPSALAINANFVTCCFNEQASTPPANMGLCGAFFAGDAFGNVSVVIAVPDGYPGQDVDIWFQAQNVVDTP